MTVEKKMIKIPHRGPINEIGGVFGPISSPYMEKTKTIIAMLKTGKKVVEVVNGKDIPLNFENYNVDHTTVAAPIEAPKVVTPVKKEYVKPTVSKKETVEEVVAPVVEAPIEEVVAPVVEAPIEEVIAPVVEEVVVEAPVEEMVAPVVEENTNNFKQNSFNKPKWNNNNKK